MDPTSAESSKLDYARDRAPRQRRFRRLARRSVWGLLPLFIYAGSYLIFAKRSFMWAGGFAVQYPGLVRFYALSKEMGRSLGNSEALIEQNAEAGGTTRQLDESLVLSDGASWHHVWRVFYVAERVELACRGEKPFPISYAVPSAIATPTAPPSKASAASSLPYIGAVYGDWFVRDGAVYRFVTAAYAARDISNTQARRNDVYLFEWSLAAPLTEEPRLARRVRLVESNGRASLEPHWFVDADHFITWNQNTGETRLFACGQVGPATVAATIKNVRPVRCNKLSPISVSPSARYLVGENPGLTTYRCDTFKVARQVPESDASARFFASRTDELDPKNSSCYLMDDGATLVRVVTVFKNTAAGFVNGTSVVVWNFDSGEVRDLPVKVGVRADVQRVALIDNHLWLYLTYTDGKVWKQCLFDPDDLKRIDLHPANRQIDSIAMHWDPTTNTFVDLPGFEANPQSLELDSEICAERVDTGSRNLGLIRYADPSGRPNLFVPGKMKLDGP